MTRPSTTNAMGSVVQMEEIAHVPAIASLSLKERTSLLGRMTRRRVLENRLVYRKGDKGSVMGFILSGMIKIRQNTSSTSETVVAILGPGAYIGEISMLTGRPRSFDVVTVAKADIIEITREDFIAHTQRYKGFAISLMVALAGRLDDAGKRIIDQGEQHIPTRIMRVLTQLGTPVQTGAKVTVVVRPRPTQHDLVGLVGAPRDKVWAALRELERTGVIVIKDSEIVIEAMAAP